MKRLLLLTLILCGYTYAQYNIFVEDQSTDNVGNRLAYKLQEEFRKSYSFNLLRSYPDGENTTGYILILNTMDRFSGDRNNENISTMYSWILLLKPLKAYSIAAWYFTSNMGYAGSNKLQDAAEGIVADIKRFLDNLGK